MRNWCNASFLERYGVTLTENSLDILWASIVSVFLIGGCAGSLGGAWIADNLGRYVSHLQSIAFVIRRESIAGAGIMQIHQICKKAQKVVRKKID